MPFLVTALIAAAAPAAASMPDKAADCPRTAPHYAGKPGEPAKFHKLADLPDASAYNAVFRQIGGCEVPLLIKHDVSGKR